MEPLEVDCFFSFRSPWSYLAVPRLLELQTDYTAKVNLRVVNPLYIRFNAFFDKAPEKWLHYFRIDLIRHLEYLGMPLGPPRPDPINDQLPADSPDHLVLQLNPLGIAAEALGKGVEFAREISAMVWDGTVDGWNTGDHIEKATERAGLTLSAIKQWGSDNAEQWPASWQPTMSLCTSITGVFRPWSSTTSPFSGRTGSNSCAGDWRKTDCSAAPKTNEKKDSQKTTSHNLFARAGARPE